MVPVEPSDRRDPCAAWNGLGARRERLLDVANREGVLERRMVAGPIPHQHDVVVVVDDARHRRAAFQVDHPDAGSRPGRRPADGGEASVPDRHRVHDGVAAVHRVDAAVDEDELRIGRGSASRGALRHHGTSPRPSERRGDTGRRAGAEQLAA